jgi:outer membrane protein TolC
LREAVYTRYEAGQALKTDLLSADTAESRSQWKKSSAQIEVQQSYLTLMVLTGDLSPLEN